MRSEAEILCFDCLVIVLLRHCLERGLRGFAVKLDPELVQHLAGQGREVPAILGWDENPPRARVHRHSQLVTKPVNATQYTVQAHLAKDDQLRADRPGERCGEQRDVKRHAEVRSILALSQAHHLDVHVVLAQITIYSYLFSRRAEIVVRHAG